MLIKAKMSTHQNIISPEACHTMLSLIENGPIHPLHLNNFLKRFYLDSQEVTPTMVFNFHLKCKDLKLKYGCLGNVPTEQANAVFDPSSLENAPEHWDTNPKYSKVFKDATQEILLGPVENFDGQIAIVKLMEKVIECQGNRYNYRVFYTDDRQPAGLMYMTLYQIQQFLQYGDLSSLDWQLKRKNTNRWVFCGHLGTNSNKRLVHFALSFMIAELGFAEFLLKSMSEISARSLEGLKVIAMDGKFQI